MFPIDIYADGASLQEVQSLNEIVQGYTFNPSLFKSLGVMNYIDYCKEILKITDKPVSFEVIADEPREMVRQARILSELGNNVYVKIPITFCNGAFTWQIIRLLIEKGLNLNITAIFTKNQVQHMFERLEQYFVKYEPPIDIRNSQTILSVFAGRLFDIGMDAVKVTKEIADIVHKQSNCKVLWASSRQVYDIKNATKARCDIITMPPSLIKKLHLFNKTPEEYSLDTVKMFFRDAMEAGYEF